MDRWFQNINMDCKKLYQHKVERNKRLLHLLHITLGLPKSNAKRGKNQQKKNIKWEIRFSGRSLPSMHQESASKKERKKKERRTEGKEESKKENKKGRTT